MDNIEIGFDEVILDDEATLEKGAMDFKAGDSIVYFKGNNTWRAEVVKKSESGYIIKDF